jgi:Domain of unknown function (DUF4439)
VTGSTSALDRAWQAALAAEHEALFGYGVLGPALTPADRNTARAFAAAHQALRNATEAGLTAAGRPPVQPAADYPTLYPVADPAVAHRLAVRLEDGCAAAWRYLYLQAASTAGTRATALRTSAQAALTASAVRATHWRALVSPRRATTAFPGL